jgi:uncharacterized protein YbjT (DUF2867 family)
MTTSILVTGATGNQGGSVIDHLLASDTEFELSGLTRDAESEAATALADRGVRVVEGDLNDQSTLAPHVENVDAVFAVTNFWTAGYDQQVQQGKNIAEVAAAADIQQFVFSGVGGHEAETGVPHFDSAWEIEQRAQELDLPLTVLKPVFFYQNFETFVDSIVDDQTLAFPLEEGVSLQMVDVDDVGRAAAVAFENPADFVGERYDLAGDELTLDETAEVFSRVTGEGVEAIHVPTDEAAADFGEEFTVMCEWFNEVGYSADIEALEDTFGFQFTRLPEYLRAHGWADKSEPASTPGWVKAM